MKTSLTLIVITSHPEDFHLFSPSVFLHACRALAVCAVITGFFGGVLALVGMKCTKIGGSEIANSRVTFASGITYLASGKKKMFLLFQEYQPRVDELH